MHLEPLLENFGFLMEFFWDNATKRVLNPSYDIEGQKTVQILDDSVLIDRFFDRDESAIGQLKEKYGKLCLKVAGNILPDERDARECVNDAYLRIWNTIPPKRPDSLSAYAAALTRNAALDRYDYNNAAMRSSALTSAFEELEGDALFGDRSAEDSGAAGVCDIGGEASNVQGVMISDGFREKFSAVLNSFLRGLKKEARVFFVRRYWYGQSIGEIASAYHVSEEKVKASIFRTRKKLRETLEKEGIEI